MELRHLRYFVALAEELHFGRAAQRLHIVQSALSKQMIALERELGISLIDRSHGVHLTPAGQALLEEAQAIIARVERAIDKTRATARGEIGRIDIGFIGAARWSVLPSIMREHARRFPSLGFQMYELTTNIQMEQLREGSLDVGFLRALAPDSDLEFEPIWREPIVVGLPADHRLADEEAVDILDLKDETFFIQQPTYGPPGMREVFESVCVDAGFIPKMRDVSTMAELSNVAMGFAVTLVAASAENIGLNGIVFRPLTTPTPELELMVACRRGAASQVVQTFLETVRAVVPTVRAPGRALVGDAQLSAGGRGRHR